MVRTQAAPRVEEFDGDTEKARAAVRTELHGEYASEMAAARALGTPPWVQMWETMASENQHITLESVVSDSQYIMITAPQDFDQAIARVVSDKT